MSMLLCSSRFQVVMKVTPITTTNHKQGDVISKLSYEGQKGKMPGGKAAELGLVVSLRRRVEDTASDHFRRK